MAGAQPAVTVTVEYMNVPDIQVGAWLPFNPPGACITQTEIVEGRSRSATGATIPGAYKLRWEISNGAAFAAFDELREGRPLRVTFTHPTAGDAAWVGWINGPPTERFRARTVEVEATDGIGRLQQFAFDDYVPAALRVRGDITNYWRLDESESIFARPSIGSVSGTYKQEVAGFRADPLRQSVSGAVQLADIGNPDTGGQYVDFGGAIGGTTSHVIGVTFKPTENQLDGFEKPIAGWVNNPDQFGPPPTIETIGLSIDGTVVTLYAAGQSFATFNCIIGRVYTAVISYNANFNGTTWGYQARGHCIAWPSVDNINGVTVVNQATKTGTVPGGLVGTLAVGPYEGVCQDLAVITYASLPTNAATVELCETLRAWSDTNTATQYTKVVDLTDVPRDTTPPSTTIIDSPIVALSPIANWARSAEITEVGAIYWREALLRFKTAAQLDARTPQATFDGAGGIEYDADIREWTDIYNRAIVSGPTGTEQTVDRQASVIAYGVRSISVNSLTDNISDQIDIALNLLDRHGWPRRNWPSLRVDYMTTGETAPLWQLGLFDRVTVNWPDGSSTDPHITGRRITYTPDQLEVDLALTDLSDRSTLEAPEWTSGTPTILGTIQPGSTLTLSTTGTWTGSPTIAVWWEYSTNNGTTWSTVDSVGPAASITIPPGLEWAGRRIRANVVGVNESGSGNKYTAATSTIRWTPAQVSNVTADPTLATPGGFSVSWDRPFDGGYYGALTGTSFDLQISATPDFAAVIGGGTGLDTNILSRQYTGFTPGELLYVRVAYRNLTGLGQWSEAVPVRPSATSGPITVPLAGAAAATVTGSASLRRTRKLAATTDIDVAASGTVTEVVALTGTAAVAVASTGSLEGNVQLAGTATAAVTPAGQIAAVKLFTGTTVATVTPEGDVTVTGTGSQVVTETGDTIVTETGDTIVWE